MRLSRGRSVGLRRGQHAAALERSMWRRWCAAWDCAGAQPAATLGRSVGPCRGQRGAALGRGGCGRGTACG